MLAAAVLSETAAALSLKAALDTPWWYSVVVTGYGVSFVLLSMILRAGAPIGKTYGIWAASGIALTAVLGCLIFGEPLTVTMLAGIVLVIGGVLLVEFGSGRSRIGVDG
ncbi:DMT family transporter [Rhodococcus jostii]|uniref:SMR family transporter n=1 Tax=Rhodococcus jostii TaxID=132919 RepID=A0ABU4CT66_RHOJO|nr:SMR family transporter [Rhodococcus jostii]MDV6286771.1 SMR family transporter [Rhodococcus jostii]